MPTEPERKDAPAGAPRILLTPPPYEAAPENSRGSIPGPESIEELLAGSAKWVRLIRRFIEVIAQIDLEKLELRILLVILRESWFHRSKFVWLHQDLILPSLAGIHSQNIGRPLGKLMGYKILEARPRQNGAEGFEYRLNPDVKGWFVRRNRSIPRARKTAKYIRRTLGQMDLFVDQRELDQMLEQLSFDEALEGDQPARQSLTASERRPVQTDGQDADPLTVSETSSQLSLIESEVAGALESASAMNQGSGARQSLTVSDCAQLATTSFNKSTDLKLAAASVEVTAEAALEWLTTVDRAGELKQRGAALFAAEWFKLCSAEPDYVLGDLRPALLRRMKTKPVLKPIAWMAQKARANGKFDLQSSP